MTHFYLYISCGTSLDENSRFYKVGIGESSRQSRVYDFLESYALEHGHYFVLWDNNAIDFLKRCLDSVNGTLSQVTTMSGDELRKAFLTQSPVPYSLKANQQRHDLLKRIDPAYYAVCMLRRRK